MISATEALNLTGARIPDADVEDVRAVFAQVDEHIRTRMTFDGPPPLDIPIQRLSKTGARILCFVMKRFKWSVNANLMSTPPHFAGGEPTPHHWVLQFQPAVDVYDALLADFDIDPPQLLV